MNSTLKYIALGCVALMTMACADDKLVDTTAEQAGIAHHTAHESIKGALDINGVRIAYEAKQTEKNSLYDINVAIEGHELKAKVDYSTESLVLDGYNVILSEDDKANLLAASVKLFVYVDNQTGNLTYLENSLVRLMEYWSRSPVGYAYREVTHQGKRLTLDNNRSRNEGITCIRRGTTVRAEYDDARGSVSENVVVGSKARDGYGCMGRCGADCGWGAPSSWTKDCMDHDQCSNVNFSSGGSADPNCGDEFDEAADDWLFGVIRGCRG